MSTSAIRAAIVATLETVPGVGRVHAYQRYAHSLQALGQLYRAPDGQLRGWNVSRVATSEVGNIQARTVEVIRWRLFGVMALDDSAASELAFDDLVEGVRDAFAANETLGGTVDQCTDPQGDGESCVQVDDISPGKFADVLCHLARLSLLTVRYLDRSIP